MDENEIYEETETTEEVTEDQQSEVREVPRGAAIGLLVLAGVGAVATIRGVIRFTKNQLFPGVKAGLAAYREKTKEKKNEAPKNEDSEPDEESEE